MKRTRHPYRPTPTRDGFTLVELLVVITIIGAIAALSIPAITHVLKVTRVQAMHAEMTNIQGGIDNYYTKYGDYPPDFSSWNVVKRHYLKIFPDIAQSELDLLYRMCDDKDDNNTSAQMTPNPQANPFDPTAMDRAEAVVWSLGGFSSDPQYPFTGAGGPLVRIPVPSTVSPTPAVDDPMWYEYNPTRNAPEIDFAPDRLSLLLFDPNVSVNRTPTNKNRSNDEASGGGRADVFPSYVLRDDASPLVYFDSRTYNSFVTLPSGNAFNGYARTVSGEFDVVRPVYSNNASNPPASNYGSDVAASQAWEFMNPQTYQLMAPGIDGLYGDLADFDGGDPTNAAAAYFKIDGAVVVLDPNGTNPIDLTNVLPVTRFDVSGVLSRTTNPFRDNMANFLTNTTFEDDLP